MKKIKKPSEREAPNEDWFKKNIHLVRHLFPLAEVEKAEPKIIKEKKSEVQDKDRSNDQHDLG
tara:strand:- start:604 stop:792 length:189 start_codon:yes stop_codon:yes gene_type:complete